MDLIALLPLQLAPALATMLVVVTTDAVVRAEVAFTFGHVRQLAQYAGEGPLSASDSAVQLKHEMEGTQRRDRCRDRRDDGAEIMRLVRHGLWLGAGGRAVAKSRPTSRS